MNTNTNQLQKMKEEAIKDLKNGEDWALRQYMESKIDIVITKSNKGEIATAGFLEDIRAILNEGAQLADLYWSE